MAFTSSQQDFSPPLQVRYALPTDHSRIFIFQFPLLDFRFFCLFQFLIVVRFFVSFLVMDLPLGNDHSTHLYPPIPLTWFSFFFPSYLVMDLPLGNGHWTDVDKAGRIGHGSVQTQSNCTRWVSWPIPVADTVVAVAIAVAVAVMLLLPWSVIWCIYTNPFFQ